MPKQSQSVQTTGPLGHHITVAAAGPSSKGVGARPKLRYTNPATDSGKVSQQCTDSGTDSGNAQIVTSLSNVLLPVPVPPRSKVNKRHTVAGMDIDMDLLDTSGSSSRGLNLPALGEPEARKMQDRAFRSPLDLEIGTAWPSVKSSQSRPRWSADDMASSARFDDISFGELLPKTNGHAFSASTAGELPGLTRNDSLEHLHDDRPLSHIEDDLDIGDHRDITPEPEVVGQDSSDFSTLSPSASEQVDSVHRPPPEGIASNLENRYRPVRSSNQPRPINIERNLCDNQGTTKRSYDNTVQNVNLNTNSTNKYKSDSPAHNQYTYLNNDPLAGHKIIASRNIFQGESEDVLPKPPAVGGAGGTVVEVSDSALGVRNCPVCNEGFDGAMPMGMFQQHVLDCVGPPSPPQEERLCPMCNTVFPETLTQSEFEEHVNEHFLDEPLHFEIIRP